MHTETINKVKIYDVLRLSASTGDVFKPCWRWIDEFQWQSIKGAPKFGQRLEALRWLDRWAAEKGLPELKESETDEDGR